MAQFLLAVLIALQAERPLEEIVRDRVAALAAPTRAARDAAQIDLLALPSAADGLLAAATPPAGFEPAAALAYVRAHRPRAARFVTVPAGTWLVGSDAPVDANPRREVTLAAFRIDETEVTCFEYFRFVRATGAPPPPDWQGGRYPYQGEQLPVANVAPEEAERFAAWVGGRLPTADEWEVAAHGGKPMPFPWGEIMDRPLRNAQGMLLPVGSEPADRSTFGCIDMVASLMEWVTLPDDRVARNGRIVARGGYFRPPRNEFQRLTRAPELRLSRRSPSVGLRIVR